MGGFVGVIHNGNGEKSIDMREIRLMCKQTEHRGLDDEIYYQNNDISVGYRRLSVIDLDQGKQPLSYDNDRYWIVFNGEIYNYMDLRKSLERENYEFKTHSDTEILLAGYKKYGSAVVTHLRGMFSFVIWDTKTHEVFGARDHFGIKPLFLLETNKKIYFSSEKKSLMKNIKNDDINMNALQDYFTYQYIPGESTLSNNIIELLPGHSFTKTFYGRMHIQQYFDAKIVPNNKINKNNLIQSIIETLQDSVEKHMRSDVPIGAFLSGEIDSSIIVAIAREINPKIKTFSVGFERKGYNKLDLAKQTANALQVDNESLIITPDDFMKEFSNFIYYIDDPLADPAAFTQYFLAKLSSNYCKVIMSEEGANEMFGGYRIYTEPKSLKWFKLLPKSLKNSIKESLSKDTDGSRFKNFLLRGTTPLEERFVGTKIFKEDEKQQLMNHYNLSRPFFQAVNSEYQRSIGSDPISRMQDIDLHYWLPDNLLLNADRTSVAFGLELRAPFVDRKIYELSKTIPTKLKVNHGQTQIALREAAKFFLPDEVVNHQKLNFTVPLNDWLKDDLYEWARKIIKRSSSDAIINKDYVLKLLNDHRDGTKDNSRKIWTVLAFLTWYDTYSSHDLTSFK